MKNTNYPAVKLKQGCAKRVKAGSPWVFSNEIDMTAETKNIPAGTLARLYDANGTFIGVGSFNPHSLISFRKMASDPQTEINAAFFAKKLRRCVDLRNALVNSPFYRLVHSEGDGLPGLIIDRFDDIVACQLNTAGTDALKQEIVDALDAVLHPSCIVLRAESSARALEGLDPLYEVAKGTLPDIVSVRENGIYFFADLKEGQKTGWFYDQRENRSFVGRLAPNKRCIDFYTYAGGFALHMGIGHAKEIIGVDRSESALALARKAAEKNELGNKCSWIKDNAFDVLESMNKDKEKFGIVVCDPPAFAKHRDALRNALRGYTKLNAKAFEKIRPGGILFTFSCSQVVNKQDFRNAVFTAAAQSGRSVRILHQLTQPGDHPVNIYHPEGEYLKGLVLYVE